MQTALLCSCRFVHNIFFHFEKRREAEKKLLLSEGQNDLFSNHNM